MKSKTKTPPEERRLHAVPDPEPRLRATPRAKKLGAALAIGGALFAGTHLGSSSDDAEKYSQPKVMATMSDFEQVQPADGEGTTDLVERALREHAEKLGEPAPQLSSRELWLAAKALSTTINLSPEDLPDHVDVMSTYDDNAALPDLDKTKRYYVPVEYHPTND